MIGPCHTRVRFVPVSVAAWYTTNNKSISGGSKAMGVALSKISVATRPYSLTTEQNNGIISGVIEMLLGNIVLKLCLTQSHLYRSLVVGRFVSCGKLQVERYGTCMFCSLY